MADERNECENCRFMVKARNFAPYDNYAECHRHAPQASNDDGALWPVVFIGDWCGDWEARRG